jgi:DNA-binding CsgD family transcriptional regulator
VADVLCPIVVGREAELSALDAALTAALSGTGGLVFLTGEPGIGKSRLVRETANLAERKGAPVAVGRAVPAGASTPYRPLTEALLHALRDRPLPADPDLAPWLPALGAIVPGLGGAEHSESSSAIRGEAVIRLLRRLGRPGGLVVMLEDLHWADPDTLAVAEYLADNLSSQPVLVVATSRNEPRSAALDMIRRLHGRRAAAHLPLDRLPPSQVAAMIRACAPDAGDDVVTRVEHAADGVPFLVEEVLASPGVPVSFRDTVRARLAEMGEGEQAVLQAAAVLGRHFDWRLLAGITGQPPDLVAHALEGGVAQFLLAVEGQEFGFRHSLTRDAVAETLLPPRHGALAAAALRAVESAHPDLAGPWRDTAADLADQAGNREQAGALLAASGSASLSRGALATAISTLHRAAGLLGHGPPRTEAEQWLVEALALAGRVDEAMSVGIRLITRLSEDPATGRDRARIHVRLAHAAVAATRWPAASEHLAAARGLLAQYPDPVLAAQVAVLAAEVALAADDPGLARRLADGVLAGEGASPEVRCHALELVGRSERLHDLDAAQDAFERALALAESAGLPFWRLRALHELGTIELFDHAGTVRLRQARETAAELGALSTAAVLDLQLAAAGDSLFNLDDAARHARDCLAISERLGLPQVRAKALCFLAENAAMRRDHAQAEHFIALTMAAADGDRELEAFCWGAARAMMALLDGDQSAAMRAFGRAAAILRERPHAEPASFRGLWLVVLASLGDGRTPDEIDLAVRSGITIAFSNRGMLRYAEAILAGRAGDADRAAELAVAGDADLAYYPVWADLARMYMAEAALADGWGEPQRWLRSARECFTGRGLDRLARRCEALLGEPSPDRWALLGVTAREADVLRLVAEGLANRDIAARLYLSPRTVEKHVESLLRKTGARSRTQLVAIAGPPPAGPAG